VSEAQKIALLALYRRDLERYATDCLRIRTKESEIINFPGFNRAQRYAHGLIERQLRDTGKVRAIILKGRQQGFSTYTAVRYYRKATLHRAINVYILSHEQTASDALFGLVDRFQKFSPIAPRVGVSNAKELVFDRLDSSYTVATAGQKAGGRSKTTTLYHGSEVAFWQSAKDHFASSVQTVPDLPGTEIILESTANGASGEFYERWHRAIAGEGDYIPIFIPWFWQEEYQRTPPAGFELSAEAGDTGMSEREYAELFKLTDAQMAWRRAKVDELGGVRIFDQEYPGSPDLAFQSSDPKKALIQPIHLLRARKRKAGGGVGPLIIGADPSGPGKDRFAVAARQGLELLWAEARKMPDTAEAVLWLRALIDDHAPDRMFVDLGNIGHAIVSLLRGIQERAPDGRTYAEIVRGVNFGGTSQAKLARPKVPGPRNRRAEMWDRTRQWLELDEGVKIPDMDALQADAMGPHIKPLVSGDFLLESKEQMASRGVRSPDYWDAVALTFAESERILDAETRKRSGGVQKKGEQRSGSLRIAPAVPVRQGVFAPTRGPDSWMG